MNPLIYYSVSLVLSGICFGQVSSFEVTELEGQEITFNDAGTNYGTPTGLNSLESFTVQPAAGGSTTTYQHSLFQALTPSGVNPRYTLQYQTPNPQIALFSTQAEYLSAGRNGLSLSTGVNLRTSDPVSNWSFTRIFLDNSKVNDGVPDFLAVDIAQNQSGDLWDLTDLSGTVLATATFTSSDWNQLGVQNLARTDFNDPSLPVSNFDNRNVYGLAAELSDFVIAGTTDNLDSTDTAVLDNIAFLKVRVPGEGSEPRTDYAFISSNTESIRFAEQVPEPGSLSLLLTFVMLTVLRRQRA